MRPTLLIALLLLPASAADARPVGVFDHAVVMESLSVMGPLLGHRWLEKTGQRDFLLGQFWQPESAGLRCVGRWSFGPSLKVSVSATSGDTVICLTRGSGASLVRFRSQGGISLDLLGDVDFAGIPHRAILTDTLVVAGIYSGGSGLEVHGVFNPASPNLLGRVNLPMVNDIAVSDTFVYVAGEDDSLRIYSIADPRNPRRLGACRDSCDLFMTQAGGFCYLIHVSGVNIVDVRDPAAPHRIGRIGVGAPLAALVRDTLAYVTVDGGGLRVYNVSNPVTPTPVGSLSIPEAFDLALPATCDTMLYTPVLDIINVANPASPRLVGHVDIPAEFEYGVAVLPTLDHALVANYTDGVVVVDVSPPSSPAIDTFAFGAGPTVDIAIDNGRAYLAHTHSGMSVLDVSNPVRPVRLGAVDIGGLNPTCRSVAAKDSFAYMHWYLRPQLQSVDVSDPARPRLAGGADVFNPPEDMVVRDSFVYVAEANRFQVVNVARPREPRLVGSCVDADYTWDMDLEGNLAAVAHILSLRLVDVTDPVNPGVVGLWGGDVNCVDLVDTVAFAAGPYTGIVSLSIARPGSPYVLDSLHLTDTLWWNDIVVVDSVAFVGGERVWGVGVSDPGNLRLVPGLAWAPPYTVRRLAYSAPYVYAACYDAGVCILETTATALAEHGSGEGLKGTVRVGPSPTRGRVDIVLGEASTRTVSARVLDIAGKEVMRRRVCSDAGRVTIDLSELPAGVYFVGLDAVRAASALKVLKQQ